VLESAVGVSPGTWSRHGSTLTYENASGGLLQQIESDGTAGLATPFPDFHYSCDQRWYSETEFVYGGCENTDVLRFVALGADGLSTTEVPGIPAEHLILSQDDQCLIAWGGTGATIGAVNASPFSPSDIPNSGGDVDWVQLSPDGTQLVWVEDRLVQYRIEIADCMAQGEPEKLVEFESPINDMDFLVYYDR
jgi:hypothetical protein